MSEKMAEMFFISVETAKPRAVKKSMIKKGINNSSQHSYEKVLPRYLRGPLPSCHDWCKYGITFANEMEKSRPFFLRSSGSMQKLKQSRALVVNSDDCKHRSKDKSMATNAQLCNKQSNASNLHSSKFETKHNSTDIGEDTLSIQNEGLPSETISLKRMSSTQLAEVEDPCVNIDIDKLGSESLTTSSIEKRISHGGQETSSTKVNTKKNLAGSSARRIQVMNHSTLESAKHGPIKQVKDAPKDSQEGKLKTPSYTRSISIPSSQSNTRPTTHINTPSSQLKTPPATRRSASSSQLKTPLATRSSTLSSQTKSPLATRGSTPSSQLKTPLATRSSTSSSQLKTPLTTRSSTSSSLLKTPLATHRSTPSSPSKTPPTARSSNTLSQLKTPPVTRSNSLSSKLKIPLATRGNTPSSGLKNTTRSSTPSSRLKSTTRSNTLPSRLSILPTTRSSTSSSQLKTPQATCSSTRSSKLKASPTNQAISMLQKQNTTKSQNDEMEQIPAKGQDDGMEQSPAKIQDDEMEQSLPKIQDNEGEQSPAMIQEDEMEQTLAKSQGDEMEQSPAKIQGDEMDQTMAKNQDDEMEQSLPKIQYNEGEQSPAMIQEDEMEQTLAKSQGDEMEQSLTTIQDDEMEQSLAKIQDDEGQQSPAMIQENEMEQTPAKSQCDEMEQSLAKIQDDEREQSSEKIQDDEILTPAKSQDDKMEQTPAKIPDDEREQSPAKIQDDKQEQRPVKLGEAEDDVNQAEVSKENSTKSQDDQRGQSPAKLGEAEDDENQDEVSKEKEVRGSSSTKENTSSTKKSVKQETDERDQLSLKSIEGLQRSNDWMDVIENEFVNGGDELLAYLSYSHSSDEESITPPSTVSSQIIVENTGSKRRMVPDCVTTVEKLDLSSIKENLKKWDSSPTRDEQLLEESESESETNEINIISQKELTAERNSGQATNNERKISSRSRLVNLQPESNTPVKLKFRKGRTLSGNYNDTKEIKTMQFRKPLELAPVDSNSCEQEAVILKHQEVQDKEPQGLFNNMIEETANKLVEARKSKVKALVGAFETVISLQENEVAPVVEVP